MIKLNSNDPRVQQAIVLYKSGITVKPICLELHLDGEAIRRVFKDLGILRTRSKAMQALRSGKSVKDDCFDILTPEACYWIGFLYADGHIEKSRPRISVTVDPKDIEHMKKFASFVGANILKVTGGYYRVAFSSQKIHDLLMLLGFTNRKTWGIIPHETLKHSRDFWRGVIDGDGWLYKTRYAAMGVCGHVNTMEEFLIFINSRGVNTTTRPSKRSNRKFLWSVNIHCNKAIQICHILYKDATVYLDRKYETYITKFCEN